MTEESMTEAEARVERGDLFKALEEFGDRLAKEGYSFYLWAGRGTVGAEYHGNQQPPTLPADQLVEVLNLTVLEICKDFKETEHS